MLYFILKKEVSTLFSQGSMTENLFFRVRVVKVTVSSYAWRLSYQRTNVSSVGAIRGGSKKTVNLPLGPSYCQRGERGGGGITPSVVSIVVSFW